MNRVRISISKASHGRMVTLQLLSDKGMPDTSLHTFPDIGGNVIGTTTVYSPLLKYNGSVVFMRNEDALRMAQDILGPLDFARPQMRIAA